MASQPLLPEVPSNPPVAISVALCTYNGARFIEDQIRSICGQTLLPQEIVLSDDASQDGCVAIARKAYAACVDSLPHGTAPVMRVMQNPKALGVTKNFEQAVCACEGRLITLCDQDDVWLAHKLARVSAEFERRPDLLLLHTNARLVDGRLEDLGRSLFDVLEVSALEKEQVHRGAGFDVLLKRNLVTGATTAFRRSLLEAALPFPTEWLHDEWLALIAAAVGKVDLLEECLIDYRQHGSNQVGAGRLSLPQKVRKALASRGSDPARRFAKASVLLARLQALDGRVSAIDVKKAQFKVEHQRRRAALPANRLARWLPVLREAMTGRYESFDYGFQGVLRDLLEAP